MKRFLMILACCLFATAAHATEPIVLPPVSKEPAAQEKPPAPVVEETQNTQPRQMGIPTVALPWENLNIFDPLPDYTKSMPDEMFIKWAKAQNEMSYRQAQKRADEWNARNPALDFYVQTNDYDSSSDLNQRERATSTGASVNAQSDTKYQGRSTQQTYRDRNRWGGGPVTLINPYFRGN